MTTLQHDAPGSNAGGSAPGTHLPSESKTPAVRWPDPGEEFGRDARRIYDAIDALADRIDEFVDRYRPADPEATLKLCGFPSRAEVKGDSYDMDIFNVVTAMRGSLKLAAECLYANVCSVEVANG